MKVLKEKLVKIVSNEQGTCPYCNSNDIEYDSIELQDDGMFYYPCHCDECGRYFEEWYESTFAGMNVGNSGEIEAKVGDEIELDESCSSKKKSKKLNETWKGEDVIADLVDRAQSLIDDGNYGDVDDCVRQAIDDGLIYSKDIWDLAEHYGVVDDSELIERYYEDLFSDIYSRVEEKEEDEEGFDESLKETDKKKPELKKELDESITVEIDEDEALEMLMSRLSHWTQDPIAEELYEQMYQSYIDGGVFDGGKFDVMQIVDNDWVNYCEVVEPGDEEHHYDELLKLYEEQGLGDVSTEDVGVSYIEAATERDGKVYFLCRW